MVAIVDRVVGRVGRFVPIRDTDAAPEEIGIGGPKRVAVVLARVAPDLYRYGSILGSHEFKLVTIGERRMAARHGKRIGYRIGDRRGRRGQRDEHDRGRESPPGRGSQTTANLGDRREKILRNWIVRHVVSPSIPYFPNRLVSGSWTHLTGIGR